jgi:hypothetical protein
VQFFSIAPLFKGASMELMLCRKCSGLSVT